ncbi:hypothetical protein RRG08_014981 [Elysia crispata]|uniref:Uncharacterized protein n=1 Tax=Elysia crispata TaxID=231223 RepID=A0AAE0ZW49_9GAST|nr:hypothetical protein RRG08_014981 [Elysia crispata]
MTRSKVSPTITCLLLGREGAGQTRARLKYPTSLLTLAILSQFKTPSILVPSKGDPVSLLKSKSDCYSKRNKQAGYSLSEMLSAEVSGGCSVWSHENNIKSPRQATETCQSHENILSSHWKKSRNMAVRSTSF